MKSCIPIVYRCDSKFKFFLLNSIESVLKYYNDSRELVFFICTNDDSLTLSELDKIITTHKFKYHIVNVNHDFADQHYILANKAHLLQKKFFGFNNNYTSSDEYNKTIYPLNPFNRSKAIIAVTMFFLATTTHEKVICLDTDTLVISNIADLFDTDVSKTIGASCMDWVDTHIINPSVAVVNVKEFQNVFFKKDGILDDIERFSEMKLTDDQPYCEVVQKSIDKATSVYNRIILDRSWNVPITHSHLSDTAKIYHFSESWTGNPTVLGSYNILLDKFLHNDN